MKKNLIIASMLVTALSTTAFADDVELVCTQKNAIQPIMYTLFKNNNTQSYSLLKEESGYNSQTRKPTRTVDFLHNTMKCSMETDYTFQCEQIRYATSDPHETFHKYTLTKNSELNTYSLEHDWTYQEYRTGRWIKGSDQLAKNLICK